MPPPCLRAAARSSTNSNNYQLISSKRASYLFSTTLDLSLCGFKVFVRSTGLEEENWDFIIECAEQVALSLVNDVRAEILADDAVPWFTWAYYSQLLDSCLRGNLPNSLSNSALILFAMILSSFWDSKVSVIVWGNILFVNYTLLDDLLF